MKLLLIACLLLSGCAYTATEHDIAEANSGAMSVSWCSGTGSMLGTLTHQRMICQKDWESIKAGDIITGHYQIADKGIVHRAVAPRYDRNGNIVAWWTKGDANDKQDPVPLWMPNYTGTKVRN